MNMDGYNCEHYMLTMTGMLRYAHDAIMNGCYENNHFLIGLRLAPQDTTLILFDSVNRVKNPSLGRIRPQQNLLRTILLNGHGIN